MQKIKYKEKVMEKLNFSYYYGNQAEQFSFFRIPKLLFTDKSFNTLSSDAKVLYGMLLDRMSLSMKNEWLDDENRVYIIFTIDEIVGTMNFGKNKAINTMKELENFGLIEKKRKGLGKPNIIYVMNFLINKNDFTKTKSQEEKIMEMQEDNSGLEDKIQEVSSVNLQKFENQTSGSLENKLQEVSKTNSNKTNINNTDYSYTDFTNTSPISPLKEKTKILNEVEEVEKEIKENIEYISLIQETENTKVIDSIVSIMTESIVAKKDLKINQIHTRYEKIRDTLLSIRKEHIEYVLDYLRENKPKIINFRAYILSLLYNADLNLFTMNSGTSTNIKGDYSNDSKLWQDFISST